MAPYAVLPAQPADVPAIVRVNTLAFASDHLINSIWEKCDPTEQFEYNVQAYDRHFANCHLTGERMFKVVDEGNEGQVVAYARWQYPHTLNEEAKKERQAMEREAKGVKTPTGTNEGLLDKFMEELEAGRDRFVRRERDYYLHILTVHPEHQRRGLGSMLIAAGLKDADRDNASTYIEASPVGVELYKRFGWKQVHDILIDIGKFGGKGMASEKCFVRPPAREMGANVHSA